MSALDLEKAGTPDDPLMIAMNRMKDELFAYKQPRKILFVEDDEPMRKLFALWALDFNCVVEYASDGETGCAKAIATPFDLIILDITLPKKDGIECFECIRKTLGDVPPIAFFTGRLNDADGDRISKTGFASFIKKPDQFNPRFITSFFHNFYIFKKPIEAMK